MINLLKDNLWGIDECASCGEKKQKQICHKCGTVVEVINCGHMADPQIFAYGDPPHWTCACCAHKMANLMPAPE